MNNEKIYAKSGCSVLGGKTKKACPSTKQGSILAYSLIILSIMLVIATSVSKSAILGKKGASATEASVQSLQTADSGVQLAIKELNTYPGNGNINAALGNAFGSCSGSIFTSDNGVAGPAGSVFKLAFFDQAGNPLACNDPASDVANIKSIGTYENTVRAVSVDMAAALAQCDASTPPGTPCSFGGLTYIPVDGEDGEVWLDRNLGATQVATASNDADAYGWLFQWGRMVDNHQIANPISGTSLTPSSTDDVDDAADTGGAGNNGKYIIFASWRIPLNNSLWQIPTGNKNNPCPAGFHVPTQGEWGGILTVASITNNNTAFNSALKLPTAGSRNYFTGNPENQGTHGYYWSSTPRIGQTYMMTTSAASASSSSWSSRGAGMAVRCIRD